MLQRARGHLPALDLARHARVRQLGVGHDDAVCDVVVEVLRGGGCCQLACDLDVVEEKDPGHLHCARLA